MIVISSDWRGQCDFDEIHGRNMKYTGCPVTIAFFKMATHYITIMNGDIGKFVYDSMRMQQRKKR